MSPEKQISMSNGTLDMLAIAPHPDDAELFCGGLLALMVSKGYRVGILDLTRGERGSQGTVQERSIEAEAASKVLGLAHRENLELLDGGISPAAWPGLVEVLRRLRPVTILAPHYEDRHPDHRNAAQLVRDALLFSGGKGYRSGAGTTEWSKDKVDLPPFRPSSVFRYLFRTAGPVSFMVDITSVSPKKYEAIRCYRSQIERSSNAGSFGTVISSPRTISSLQSRDGYFGSMIGVEFAEGYVLDTPVHLDDPIAYAKSRETSQSLFFPEPL